MPSGVRFVSRRPKKYSQFATDQTQMLKNQSQMQNSAHLSQQNYAISQK